jgi:hypothetical protein
MSKVKFGISVGDPLFELRGDICVIGELRNAIRKYADISKETVTSIHIYFAPVTPGSKRDVFIESIIVNYDELAIDNPQNL